MELLGSYFLQMFNLSDSSWKFHMLDRLLSFDSVSIPLDKPLSVVMIHLGSFLNLDPAILAALPFPDAPAASPFSRSSDTSNIFVAFNTGFIVL